MIQPLAASRYSAELRPHRRRGSAGAARLDALPEPRPSPPRTRTPHQGLSAFPCGPRKGRWCRRGSSKLQISSAVRIPRKVVVLAASGHGEQEIFERPLGLDREQRVAKDLPVLRLRRAAMTGSPRLELPDDLFLEVANDQLAADGLPTHASDDSTAATAPGLYRTALDDPFGRLPGDFGDVVVIAVVVDQDEPGGLGGGRDDEVGDRHSMVAVAGELALDFDGAAEDQLGDGDRVIGESPAFPDELVIGVVACAVEDFEVDHRAGRGLSGFDDGSQPPPDRFERQSGQDALVDEVSRPHVRQAPAITSSSIRSMPRMVASASTSSRRASAFRISWNACSMVSLRVAVERMR